jgi:hypothetical protein
MARCIPSSARDKIALDLASGKTVREAAADHNIGERTLHRWLAEDEAFRRQVEQLRAELFSSARGVLAAIAR